MYHVYASVQNYFLFSAHANYACAVIIAHAWGLLHALNLARVRKRVEGEGLDRRKLLRTMEKERVQVCLYVLYYVLPCEGEENRKEGEIERGRKEKWKKT